MKPYYEDKWATIYCKDSRDMSEIKDGIIDLTITSPPYFVGKDYEAYLRTFREFLAMLDKCWQEVTRKTILGGLLVIDIAHNAHVDTPSFVSMQLANIGWRFRDKIIWEKPDAASPRFGLFVQNPFSTWYYPNQTYEHLLIYSNGQANRAKINSISLEYAKKFRGDIWKINAQTNSEHEAPFPEDLIVPLITFYSNPKDLILDPFLGSGTTAWCAKKLGRKCIGYEIKEEYCEMAANRCRQTVMELGI